MSVYIKNLCKSFGQKKVLNNLNLTLEDGKIYCLMGPSGMGKTTLLRIIMDLETKDSGEITGINPETEISSMFQEDRMLSAIDNVNMMYEKKRPVREIKQDLSTILPRKCLSQPVCELSGGMKRRVSLARSVHFQGKMIILDEPFTGLDHVTKEEVISYILKNRRGRILLVATHGLDDAELLGAEVIHLEDCQELTPEMKAALPKPETAMEKEGLIFHENPRAKMFQLPPVSEVQKIYSVADTIKLLDGIPKEQWESLVDTLGGRVQNYQKEKIIWEIGDTCKEFAVVLDGEVAAYTKNLRGTNFLVSKFGPGRCFGEMLPVSGEPSPVEVVATMPSRIMFLSLDKLKETPETIEEAQVKAKIAWNLTYEVVDKLQRVSNKLVVTSETTIWEKVVKYLYSLPEDKKGWRTMFPIQRETAQYLSVTPEALSTEFAEMEQKGLIEKMDNRVKILDPERLMQVRRRK